MGFTALVTLIGLLCLPFKSFGVDYEKITHEFIQMVNNNHIFIVNLLVKFIITFKIINSHNTNVFEYIIFIYNNPKMFL